MFRQTAGENQRVRTALGRFERHVSEDTDDQSDSSYEYDDVLELPFDTNKYDDYCGDEDDEACRHFDADGEIQLDRRTARSDLSSNTSWSSLESAITLDSALHDDSFPDDGIHNHNGDDFEVAISSFEDDLTSSARFKPERRSSDPNMDAPIRAAVFEDELMSSDRFKAERRSSMPIVLNNLSRHSQQSFPSALPVRKPIRQNSGCRRKAKRQSLPVRKPVRQPSGKNLTLNNDSDHRPRPCEGKSDLRVAMDEQLLPPPTTKGSKRQHCSSSPTRKWERTVRRGKKSDFVASAADHHHDQSAVYCTRRQLDLVRVAPPSIPTRGSNYRTS